MVPGKRPGNEIKLRIQGLERLVSVDKLSNKWPEEHELVVLQVS